MKKSFLLLAALVLITGSAMAQAVNPATTTLPVVIGGYGKFTTVGPTTCTEIDASASLTAVDVCSGFLEFKSNIKGHTISAEITEGTFGDIQYITIKPQAIDISGPGYSKVDGDMIPQLTTQQFGAKNDRRQIVSNFGRGMAKLPLSYDISLVNEYAEAATHNFTITFTINP